MVSGEVWGGEPSPAWGGLLRHAEGSPETGTSRSKKELGAIPRGLPTYGYEVHGNVSRMELAEGTGIPSCTRPGNFRVTGSPRV